jgi:hypothetical protein
MWQRMFALSGKDFLILGTPGIGKSFFLIYIVWRLVTANSHVTIVVDHHLLGVLVFDADGVQRYDRSDLCTLSMLDLPTTWYLVDAVLPRQCEARTVFVTSLFPKTFKISGFKNLTSVVTW